MQQAWEPILLSSVAYRMNHSQLQVLWLLSSCDSCHSPKRIYSSVNGSVAFVLTFLLYNPSTGLTPISQALCFGSDRCGQTSEDSGKPFIIRQHDSPAIHTSAGSCQNSAAIICTQQSKGESDVSGGVRRVDDHGVLSNAACDYKFDAKLMECVLLHTSHSCPTISLDSAPRC